MSGSESVLASSWEQVCVLMMISMRAPITFGAGQSSEIGRYELPREESFAGFKDKDDLQIAGIRHDVMESLKSTVRYSIAMGPRVFR